MDDNGIPPWYDFYDEFMYTKHLLGLTDVKFPNEIRYTRLHAQFLRDEKKKKEIAELRTCRLFALPSKKEGFGLVFLEAMAHGRPCLGASAGGIPEVITPETGVLTAYGDVPGLAAGCIAALQRDWDEAAILARARHFSYSQFRSQLASLLPA